MLTLLTSVVLLTIFFTVSFLSGIVFGIALSTAIDDSPSRSGADESNFFKVGEDWIQAKDVEEDVWTQKYNN